MLMLKLINEFHITFIKKINITSLTIENEFTYIVIPVKAFQSLES